MLQTQAHQADGATAQVSTAASTTATPADQVDCPSQATPWHRKLSSLPRSTVSRLSQINFNGLCSRVNLFLSDFVKSSRLDIVCITESHILHNLSDSAVQISYYALIWSDVKAKVFKHDVCPHVYKDIRQCFHSTL